MNYSNEEIQKALKHFECMKDNAVAVLDSGFGTRKGESDTLYRRRKLIAEIAIVALEKQIPYKPKEYEDKYYACRCGNILLHKWKEYLIELMPKSEGLPHCMVCGQKLDWE